MPFITEEELKRLQQMADFTEMEKQRELETGQGTVLYGMPKSIKGKDVGSNIGRAGYGASAALKQYGAAAASAKITEEKQKLYADMLRKIYGDPATDTGATMPGGQPAISFPTETVEPMARARKLKGPDEDEDEEEGYVGE
jgi:hypothetical protein